MAQHAPLIFTGGTQVGLIHSSWPFGKLVIDGENLTLVAPTKELHFSVKDDLQVIVSKHPLFGFPQGIQIVHNKSEYPDRVIFYYLRTQRVLNKIRKTPFEQFVG